MVFWMSVFLACEGVSKHFGDQRVLDDVSFELRRGECLALLGASGCGKSTLLNILAGLLEPDAGRVACDGEVLDDTATHRHLPMRLRKFALVFQDFSLWPHLSVFENVAFGLRVTKVVGSDVERRVDEALGQVGMRDFAKRFPANLSGGQQQRVAIARAVVVRPRLLLLDEPLSALDARLRDELREEIARLVREAGLTAVYVTHDQVEALTVAHRVAVMRAGRFEQIAEPESIYQHPATAYVAGFLGNANCIAYTIEADKLHLDGIGALDLPGNSDGPRGGKGTVVLRREAVLIGVDYGFPGRCVRSSYLGERSEIEVEMPGGRAVRGYSDTRFMPGDEVKVRIDLTGMRWL